MGSTFRSDSRGARRCWKGVVALVPACLLACTDADERPSGAMGICAEENEAVPADVRARYDYDAEDLRTAATGHWEGHWPSTEAYEAFDVIVDVGFPQDVMAMPPVYGFATRADGAPPASEWDDRCAGLVGAAEINATFSPALEAHGDGEQAIGSVEIGVLAVQGFALADGPPEDGEATSGNVVAEDELHLHSLDGEDAPGGETAVQFAFSDGDLWLTMARNDAELLRHYKVGARVDATP